MYLINPLLLILFLVRFLVKAENVRGDKEEEEEERTNKFLLVFINDTPFFSVILPSEIICGCEIDNKIRKKKVCIRKQ